MQIAIGPNMIPNTTRLAIPKHMAVVAWGSVWRCATCVLVPAGTATDLVVVVVVTTDFLFLAGDDVDCDEMGNACTASEAVGAVALSMSVVVMMIFDVCIYF